MFVLPNNRNEFNLPVLKWHIAETQLQNDNL